jgi:hypothetical protein
MTQSPPRSFKLTQSLVRFGLLSRLGATIRGITKGELSVYLFLAIMWKRVDVFRYLIELAQELEGDDLVREAMWLPRWHGQFRESHEQLLVHEAVSSGSVEIRA